MTILGNQKPNPYNIDNMKQASINTRGTDAEIQTNFYYVRFEPNNLDELDLLESDTTLFLSDTPLDYEFAQEGTYYHDPNIESEHPTYYYSVIGVNQTPPNVPLTILDNLFIPDIDTQSDIECEALDLCGINYTSGSSKGMWRTKPNGRLTVSEGSEKIGLRNVKVIAYNWFRYTSTYTDNNGNFSFDKKFRRARIKVKFKTNQAKIRIVRGLNIYRMLMVYKTKIKNGNSYAFINSDLENINFNFDYYSDVTTKGCENWYCALTWNSLYETRYYTTQIGINAPPNGLNIYLTSYTNEGAAPMIHKMDESGYSFADLASTLHSITAYYILTELAAPELINTISDHLGRRMPDIIYGMESNAQYRDLKRNLLYHELGHSVHYLKAGYIFWKNEIDYTIDNMGYGTKSSNNSGICALTESWGNYFGEYLHMLRYDDANHQYAQDIELMIGDNGNPWFPVGMYWDIYDDENTLPGIITENTNITDNVNGVNLPSAYNMLQGCDDIDDYKTTLKYYYPGQQTQINTLFDGYGY
jgi:hypothetical protein